ncbi:MAG: hypothetical protein WAM85_00850 [Terracidiphilus sp.]
MSLLNRKAVSIEQGAHHDRPMMRPAGEPSETWRNGQGSQPRSGLLETCANLDCRSGWLHLWRSRGAPVFEGGWSCSLECTQARMISAVHRELDGRGSGQESHRHRIPLGLVMLQQGWITQSQLRNALDAQRSARSGRLGYWLVQQRAVSEQMVTRALGQQWTCPVLSPDCHDAAGLTGAMPRLFVDAFGALPLRLAAGRVLYMGFEESLDRVLALGTERMTGLRVESGIVEESVFHPAHAHMLEAKFPPVELVEATSEQAAAHALAKSLERARPVESRLVRVHECLWLRMWLRPQHGPLPETVSVTDVVCSIGRI